MLTNSYDSGGNLASVKGNKNGYKYKYINNLYYDHFEQRVRVEAANRVNTSYAYDTINRRLDKLVVEKNGQENLINLDYSYDEVGNITQLDNLLTGTISNQFGRLDVQNFIYDDLNRLTHGDGVFNLPQGQGKTRSYSMDMKYDTVHNILSKTQVDDVFQSSGTRIPQKKTSYTWNYRYPAATTARPHAPVQIGVADTVGVITGRTFSYDLNGNQTGWTHDSNGTRRTIAWDEENRIQSVTDNGHVKDYTYDAAGQRVSKRGPQGETVYVNQFFTMRNSTQGTKHVYAGTQRMVSKLMKQDGPGANPKGRTPYEKDQYYYHPDHLGSSSLVTDAGGKIYQHLVYFPFGETWVEETSNTQRTPYWFTAKELDEETGLYYFGARYYDPRTSVWQSVDPILDRYLPSGNRSRDAKLPGMGGIYNSKNLAMFTYSHQNPVIYTDPDGNAAMVACLVPSPCTAGIGKALAWVGGLFTAKTAATGTVVVGGTYLASQAMNNESSEDNNDTSGGAADAPTETTTEDVDGWIFGPEDDKKVNDDGSTNPSSTGTWVSPDDYETPEEATDKLDLYKEPKGRRKVTIPKGTDVKVGKTPGGQGPFNGTGGGKEINIPEGLPPGSVGPWEPFE